MKSGANQKAATAKRAPQRGAPAIGAILVTDGKLRAEDLVNIEQFANEKGIQFGEAAVELKLLSPDDIESAIARQFNYPVLEKGGAGGVSDDVIAAYNPQDKEVEALRSIRSQLMLRWLDHADKKVLSVLSPQRGDGRSWLAANLATVFAQAGRRTLLIDADMRQSRQHQLFNLDNSVGLSSLLTGRGGLDVIRRVHPHLRLFVMPAGPRPPNPQELLSRPIFDVVLDGCARQFDLVVLDTPAATESADALMLGAHSGAAVMLVRRNHTRAAALTQAMESFQPTGVSMIGTIVNEY